ncbi:DUF4124 domain-containing protein [Rhodanobacter sp. C03]|uniref:DUF4124 domain-containing protein n=1 Tax=Rhodanobacter sp. C03 TaxID=1945858 RepID=UPI0009875EA1|nr:DUF4124 domain-containing protein [Rhodanobacter sp. C03]OOG59784.1 DUF4124 domain-containing protein [Rhodanobacter sp. C03]
MRRLAALLCLILLAWATPAAAQTEIHRCIGADGNPLFTDQPCAALQATSVSPATAPGNGSAVAEPPPVLCAANLGALRQSVIDAFANRDANRMAGLMLWGGYGRGAAVADIRSLGNLMKQPLLDISPADNPVPVDGDPPAPASSSADPLDPNPAVATPAASNQLVLHTAGNDGSGSPHELRFDIVHRAGCLWLRNAD